MYAYQGTSKEFLDPILHACLTVVNFISINKYWFFKKSNQSSASKFSVSSFFFINYSELSRRYHSPYSLLFSISLAPTLSLLPLARPLWLLQPQLPLRLVDVQPIEFPWRSSDWIYLQTIFVSCLFYTQDCFLSYDVGLVMNAVGKISTQPHWSFRRFTGSSFATIPAGLPWWIESWIPRTCIMRRMDIYSSGTLLGRFYVMHPRGWMQGLQLSTFRPPYYSWWLCSDVFRCPSSKLAWTTNRYQG